MKNKESYYNILNQQYNFYVKKLAEKDVVVMSIKATQKHKQGNLLYPDLLDQLNPKHPLLQLASVIPWSELEESFLPLYSKKGRPAKPVRLMVGLLLLKQIENLSDERVVEAWVQNPYYQSFCGMQCFQWKFPCEPSDLVHFRKRIGEKGVEKILNISIKLHGEAALERHIVIDTTVQEKNITFPTDTKLRMKAITKCWRIAQEESLVLRRSYKYELKKLLRTIRFDKSRKNKKKVVRSMRRVKTIANALLRDVRRKLSSSAIEKWHEVLDICVKAINQKREDKNKIYSFHEPQTACIAKGKAHKKFEFGSKAVVAMTKENCLIVGVKSYPDNRHDSKTLEEIISQVSKNQGFSPEEAFCDRGFRGVKKVGDTVISIPKPSSKNASNYAKNKARKNFKRRSAIEPVIGHLKSDFRLARCYLKGSIGDSINLLLAAAAFNLKKWMRLTRQCLFYALNWLAVVLSMISLHRQRPAYNS